jgi:hypothetical protein
MNLRLLVATCTLAGCGLPALAQNLKPGLWEISNRMSGNAEMNSAMADAQKAMAGLPPEQRKMMEEMMAKQGVRMGAGAGGAMAVQVCMSKEMVERNELPAQQGDCKTTSQGRSGNTMKMAFTCTNPPSSGEGQVTFIGSDAYSSKMNVTTLVNGKQEKVTMDGAGRFVSADCGTLKPMQMPKK